MKIAEIVCFSYRINVIKERLEQLATEKAANQFKLDAFWVAHRAAPVKERATSIEELDVSRKRGKSIRAQIVALEALLGVVEGMWSVTSL